MYYYTIEVYYKHGEYDIVKHESQNDLINYLEEYIHKNSNVSLEISETTLDKLIVLAKRIGEEIINDQTGTGIVSVIKGEELGISDNTENTKDTTYTKLSYNDVIELRKKIDTIHGNLKYNKKLSSEKRQELENKVKELSSKLYSGTK